MVNRRLVTQAVKELLEEGTGRPVGIATAPTKPGAGDEVVELPFVVVFPLPGGMLWGPPLRFPEADAIFEYQIRSVGKRDDQVEELAFLIRKAIIGRLADGSFEANLEVPGYVVQDRQISGPPGGPRREGIIYNVDESYYIKVGQQ